MYMFTGKAHLRESVLSHEEAIDMCICLQVKLIYESRF